MRVIVPPIGNEVICMVKLTSLASVIQYSEILRNAQTIYYAERPGHRAADRRRDLVPRRGHVLSIGQHVLERQFARGVRARRRAPRAT